MHYKGARAANAHGSASQLAARLNIKHHVQLALLVPANPTPQEHARWLCDAPSNGTIAAWRRRYRCLALVRTYVFELTFLTSRRPIMRFKLLFSVCCV